MAQEKSQNQAPNARNGAPETTDRKTPHPKGNRKTTATTAPSDHADGPAYDPPGRR
jgi:hypothetical protein